MIRATTTLVAALVLLTPAADARDLDERRAALYVEETATTAVLECVSESDGQKALMYEPFERTGPRHVGTVVTVHIQDAATPTKTFRQCIDRLWSHKYPVLLDWTRAPMRKSVVPLPHPVPVFVDTKAWGTNKRTFAVSVGSRDGTTFLTFMLAQELAR